MSNSANDPVQLEKDFHLKECESLRKEVEGQIDQTRKVELVSVAGLGAFYAWYASEKYHSLSLWLMVIPLLLVLLAGLRARATITRINEIPTYIRTVKSALSLKQDGLIAWDRTRNALFPKSSPFKTTATGACRLSSRLRPHLYYDIAEWLTTTNLSIRATRRD